MESITRTVYGSQLQTAQLLGIPYTIPTSSTLNERFQIENTSVIPAGSYPKLQYFCIGNGGVRITAGPDGLPRTEQLQHRATDVSCYKPIPFVIKEINDDLSATERLKYALRKQETFNGVPYYCYYLKRIDLSQTLINLESRTINDGIISSSSIFTPGSSNLVPTPPVLNNVGTNVLSSDYVVCSAQMNLSFTEQECEYLLDAAVIMFGNEEYATISEIGLCSGADKQITLPGGSTFKEAIGVQIVSHVNTFHAIKYTSGGINATFDVGVADPLYSLV